MNEHPIEREVAETVFDNHGWTAEAGAIDMQLVAAKIDQLAERLREMIGHGAR